MKKITKLKICNWALLPIALLMLVSGIQLEATGGRDIVFVWIHIVIGIVFMAFCGWHIFLHYGLGNWFARFRKNRSLVTKSLWWTAIVTFLSGVIATAHWMPNFQHSPIGGIHGKLGFAMIILAIAHILQRRKFFSPQNC